MAHYEGQNSLSGLQDVKGGDRKTRSDATALGCLPSGRAGS
jgi:hypothetical protein